MKNFIRACYIKLVILWFCRVVFAGIAHGRRLIPPIVQLSGWYAALIYVFFLGRIGPADCSSETSWGGQPVHLNTRQHLATFLHRHPWGHVGGRPCECIYIYIHIYIYIYIYMSWGLSFGVRWAHMHASRYVWVCNELTCVFAYEYESLLVAVGHQYSLTGYINKYLRVARSCSRHLHLMLRVCSSCIYCMHLTGP
jgi:hypothetical protein